MLGNVQLFLIQMLVLFAGAQAITEVLKQTWFRKSLVDPKIPPDQIVTEEDRKQEQARQTKVRLLTCAVGIGLAFFAQINPLLSLAKLPLWQAAALIPGIGNGIFSSVVVGAAYVLNWVLVGVMAVFGAPLFNDLLNVVTAARGRMEAMKKALEAGKPTTDAINALAEALQASSRRPLSLDEARARAKQMLEAAASIQE